MKINNTNLATLLLSVGATVGANAALVTFENGNNGVAAADNKPITTDYQSNAGVRFFTGTDDDYGSYNGSAFLEQVGGVVGVETDFGFLNNNAAPQVYDTVSSATVGGSKDGLTETQRNNFLGEYFLRTPTFSGADLVVIYDTPVSAASFEIWDIDGSPIVGSAGGTERWKITPYLGDWTTTVGAPVLTFESGLDSGSSTSYDGQRFQVNVNPGGAQTFDRFVIEFAGSKTEAIGLAFNNFNTTSITTVPEPASVMFSTALCLSAFMIRRRSI